MAEIEFGRCVVCGKEAQLERTYFYYPIHCECCWDRDKDGQKIHFEIYRHCKDCMPSIPKAIYPYLKDMTGRKYKSVVVGLMPTDIEGKYTINDKTIE